MAKAWSTFWKKSTIALLFALSLFITNSMFPATAAASGPVSAPPVARYEVQFMVQMIDHHAMALQMSQLCLEKATHAELRALCSEVIAAQSAEIAEMQAWLEEWYGKTYEPRMTRMGQMERLERLNGAYFEIAFMAQLIQHHNKAIDEAQTCLERADHPQLLDRCAGIITDQAGEIRVLRSWLRAWYSDIVLRLISRERGLRDE